MSMENVEITIAFWGPTGAGKTWLMKAFQKELDYYNEEDPEFEYTLTAVNPPLVVASLDNIPNIGPRTAEWTFERRPKKKSRKHNISSIFRYHIELQDDKGANTLEMLQNPQVYLQTYARISLADCVIAALDPTLLPAAEASPVMLYTFESVYAQQSMNRPGFEAIIIDRVGYAQLISTLCGLIVKNQSVDRKKHLALCVTKIDWSRLRGREPKQVLELLFGRDMLYAYAVHENSLSIESFVTSAGGYFRGESNVDPSTGDLKYPNNWDPYNVAASFFWLFESLEKEKVDSGDYIGYPPPRL